MIRTGITPSEKDATNTWENATDECNQQLSDNDVDPETGKLNDSTRNDAEDSTIGESVTDAMNNRENATDECNQQLLDNDVDPETSDMNDSTGNEAEDSTIEESVTDAMNTQDDAMDECNQQLLDNDVDPETGKLNDSIRNDAEDSTIEESVTDAMNTRENATDECNQQLFFTRRNDQPAMANPASAAGPSTSAVPAEGVKPGSVLLWNRSDPSYWGQYKTDMSTKLNMNTLTCREDAMKTIGGESPTVSRLYRIPGVDWLLAEQEQFSSTTTLRHADLNGLPQDNTFEPLNTRSLTDVQQRARELTPPARKGKFQADNKPNNQHHKMYRQFAKPPGQTPGEYSRDYPRTTTVDGDDKRYGKLMAPVGDGLFAAYDPLDTKAAKYLIVASSDYLYTPRSLFWPDVIFLTAPKLDWGQAIGMMISVRRVVSMEPQVIVVAGSNDHLQSRGLLTRLTDGSIPSNEVIGDAIMTLLSAMAEVETAAKQRFTQNVVKVVFVLSPGYAAWPKPLQFVYTMITTIAEGRFNVIIPAPNRVVDPDNYYPSRSELPAVWADISNAIQGLKDCSTTRLVLDEVLGLELKLRPGVDDDHL